MSWQIGNVHYISLSNAPIQCLWPHVNRVFSFSLQCCNLIKYNYTLWCYMWLCYTIYCILCDPRLVGDFQCLVEPLALCAVSGFFSYCNVIQYNNTILQCYMLYPIKYTACPPPMWTKKGMSCIHPPTPSLWPRFLPSGAGGTLCKHEKI